jgi:RNA polymerase sigma-70 factor, ECF subfamily
MTMATGKQPAALRAYAGIPDDQVLAAAARGEHAALGELYDRFGGAVFALALRIIADREVAEEVTQEIFLRIWRHAGSYDPARGRVVTWILGFTHHLAIDQVRRRRVQAQPMPVNEDGELLTANVVDPSVDVEQQVVGGERRRLLMEALGLLPHTQREVIEHAYYRGLTQVEIAARVGIPLGTVKTRLRLGLRKLRGILQSQGLSPATV